MERNAPERMRYDLLVSWVSVEDLGALGMDGTWCDRIHTDVVWCQLKRHRSREEDEAALSRRIMCYLLFWPEAVHRAYVEDDALALRSHVACRSLAAPKSPGEVDIDEPSPARLADLEERLVEQGNGRIINEDMNGSEALHCACDQSFNLSPVGNVYPVWPRCTSSVDDRVAHLGSPLLILVSDHYSGPFTGEAL